jgi:hypothetical protein
MRGIVGAAVTDAKEKSRSEWLAARVLMALFARSKLTARFRARMKSYRDPVILHYMRDVDRTLPRENLKLTPAQRLE